MAKERLKKESDVVFLLPKKGGMRVPGKLFLSEKLLKAVEEESVQQVENVATLPGIVGASIGMPDMHVGYGFTVGGVSAFDAKDGIISPGGIGFDVNCLAEGTRVVSKDGWKRPIESFHSDSPELVSYDAGDEIPVRPALFMRKPASRILRLTTESGRQLRLTADHPVYTKEGMIPAGDIRSRLSSEELHVAVRPFTGIDWERPQERLLVDWSDLVRTGVTCDEQSKRYLTTRGLLPLRQDSPHIPALLRIAGYLTGDGNLTVTSRTCCASFYGAVEELELIRKDVASLGIKPSPIRSRERHHHIATRYDDVCFTCTEHSFTVQSRSFVALLHALGVPVGDKTEQLFGIPEWVMDSPLWQQRLYLAAFFGAEMSSPATISGHPKTMHAPQIGMNKAARLRDGGGSFLSDVAAMLGAFGVRSQMIAVEDAYDGVKGPKVRFRLVVNGDNRNLIDLYQYVGFEYNPRKRFLANVAVQYLALKDIVLAERTVIRKEALVLSSSGAQQGQVFALQTKNANRRFIERSVYGTTLDVRIPQSFPTLQEFLEEYTAGLGCSGFVWDEIVDIAEEDYAGYVYDFSMAHRSHNFVAEDFLVSNCGVRVLASDLDVEEVSPLIEELLEVLFERIPAGVGIKSSLRLSQQELNDVLTKARSGLWSGVLPLRTT
jgi:tRNA-splicing ligase RtcB (3'-phosphate/5'-hydroxy nucleic acid ligase)